MRKVGAAFGNEKSRLGLGVRVRIRVRVRLRVRARVRVSARVTFCIRAPLCQLECGKPHPTAPQMPST